MVAHVVLSSSWGYIPIHKQREKLGQAQAFEILKPPPARTSSTQAAPAPSRPYLYEPVGAFLIQTTTEMKSFLWENK